MLRHWIAVALLAAFATQAQAEVWQARYGVAETFNFKLFNADGTLDVDEADGGTEVSVSCNEGAETTATNDFVDEGTFYSIALTSGEMNCERIAVIIAATTTEVFFIQTNSNASAMTPANDVNLVNIAGSAVSASTAQLGVNVVNAAGTAWGSGAITAASIATDAITAAKIAADAIAASEIAADAIGAAEIANAAIDAATFASAAIDATAIATDAIGAAELAADAIGASEVAADAIGASELATGAITTAEFAAGAIDAAAIATDAIGSAEIAANAIAAAEVADGAIDNATFLCTGGSFYILGVTDCGTAQSADADELVMRSGAAFADNEAIGQTLLISGGSAGVGQAITAADNTGSSDTLNIGAWPATTPTGTITYYLFGTAASTGGGGLDAAGVRAAVGLASANLDTQLTTIDDFLDTEVAAIKTKTDFLPSATAGATGGLFIAGTNAATTITTGLTTTFTGNLTGSVGSVTGAVGSVTGAVGSVTGNVGGNVTGSVGSVASGGITATSIATDAIGAAELAADAGTELANATWSLDATSQQTQGTFGQAIGDPAADTDSIWALANTNLNATVSSRASQTTVDAVDDFVDTEIATLTTRLGTPSDLGGGASVAANLADVEAQTDDIGTAGAGLTATDDAIMTRVGAPVGASISADIAGVESGISWNSAWDAEVESEANDALVAIHLDHLLAADYDPASKPGVATALLNELVESDAGVSRLTANALEQAPTGTGESLAAIADAVWDELLSGHAVSGSSGEALTSAAAGGGLDAAGVRSAIGLATANLDTQLGAIKSDTTATLVDTAEIGVAGAGLTATDDAVMTRLGAAAGASVSADIAAVKADTAATLVDTAEIGVAGAGLTAVDDAVLAAIEQTARADAAIVNCEVNTANFVGSTTTVACVLTNRADGAITAASGDLEGRELLILSGAQLYEGRFINDSTWDAANSELRLTLSRALPGTLADAVTAIIR